MTNSTDLIRRGLYGALKQSALSSKQGVIPFTKLAPFWMDSDPGLYWDAVGKLLNVPGSETVVGRVSVTGAVDGQALWVSGGTTEFEHNVTIDVGAGLFIDGGVGDPQNHSLVTNHGIAVAAGGIQITAGGLTTDAWNIGSAPNTVFATESGGIQLVVETSGVESFSVRAGTTTITDLVVSSTITVPAASLVAIGATTLITLGKTGGGGPATPAQNSWIKILFGGVSYYVPAWV